MALLDGTNDVVIDVVMTDAMRQRLARGDGSARIVKMALSDTEIDYSQYNLNHPNGSSYFDLNILSTPIFEALTNNSAAMKYKLVTYGRNDLLYLPVIKLSPTLGPGGSTYGNAGYYIVTCNDTTITSLGVGAGIIDGQTAETAQRYAIAFEQGLDTTEISPKVQIPNDLKETQYFVYIDSRLGEIVTPNGTAKQAEVSFIDDDKQALYLFSQGTTGEYIKDITNTDGYSVISGPRGTKFQFGIRANMSLNSSNFMFNKIGSTTTISAVTYNYIDSIVRIVGGTTGFSVDLPIRFLRKP